MTLAPFLFLIFRSVFRSRLGASFSGADLPHGAGTVRAFGQVKTANRRRDCPAWVGCSASPNCPRPGRACSCVLLFRDSRHPAAEPRKPQPRKTMPGSSIQRGFEGFSARRFKLSEIYSFDPRTNLHTRRGWLYCHAFPYKQWCCDYEITGEMRIVGLAIKANWRTRMPGNRN